MEDKHFDKIIERLIEGYEIKYTSNSWQRLERKLDYEDKEDTIFDMIIADKLSNYTIPVTPGSFRQFEKRAGLRYERKFTTMKFLAGIAALFLLLIYSVFNLTISMNEKQEIASILEKSKDVNKPKFYINPEKDQTSIPEIASRNFIQKFENQEITVSTRNTVVSSNFGDNLSQKQSSLTFSDNQNIQPDQTNILDKFNNPEIVVVKLQPHVNPKKLIDFNEIDGHENKIANSGIITDNLLSIIRTKGILDQQNEITIANLQNTNLYKPEIEIREMQENQPENIVNVSGRRNKSLDIFINANPVLSFIKTPNDKILNLPGYNNIATGFNCGLGITKSRGKNEFGTGLQYYVISYNPKKVIVSSGEKSYWMDKIGFKKIGIPLIYRYHILQNRLINIYVAAGIEAQLIINSSFKFIENENNNGNLSKLASELMSSNEFRQTVYAAKEYDKGVIEGGEINSNAGLAAKLGLGIETKISPALSLFIEPEVSTALFNNSFGPNKDKFTNLNLKIGVNKSFNL